MQQTITLTENDIKNMVYSVFEAITNEDDNDIDDILYGPDDDEHGDDNSKKKKDVEAIML